MKKYIGNLMLIVFSIAFIVVVLEIATRLIFEEELVNAYDYRMAQPEPYKDSDYFSKSFVKESFHQPGGWVNPEGTRVLYPENYKSNYFNVVDNKRVTTDSPEDYKHTIHLFGGSTIYNGEVPDQYTVASFLQRILNGKVPQKYRVLNYGANSINTSQQLERLKTVDLKPQDIVVFYGGINDSWLFTSGKIDGWIKGENLVALGRLNTIQKTRFLIHNRFKRHSRFVQKFLNPHTSHVPDFLNDSTRVEQMKVDLGKSYLSSIKMADALSRSKGATFYNFLQPTILTRSELPVNEKEFLQSKFLTPKSWLLAMEYSYPILLDSNSKLANQGINSNELTYIFDQSNESYYLDICHVTEKGNNIVATAISNTLFENF